MNLEELILKYKGITLDIISAVNQEELDKLESLFLERECVLTEISNRNEEKEKLRKLYEENGLSVIDEELKKRIETSLENVRLELFKIRKMSEINKVYNTFDAKSVYISKKI